MRDRLKRRKGKTQESPAEPKPAPLQPDFYAEAPVASEARAVKKEDVEPVRKERAEAAEPPAETAAGSGNGNGDARRRRRRRGRGGRSRGSASQAVAVSSDQPEATSPAASQPESAAPDSVPAAPARPPKGVVVLAIGLPGSGKSAWFKRNNITPLSSDLLRALLFDDATEQRFQDLVFSNLRSMLKARLVARRPMNYVDATNLTPQERQGWIKLAKDYNYEVQAVFFDVPIEVCLERNARRSRVVPEDAMRRMAGKLKAPKFEEGFAKITVVRVKPKE
ncbi:MAG TPA: AAA family ATPase [Terriglobales bacterium]